jgi:MYXO-CTERM domain-containing protein
VKLHHIIHFLTIAGLGPGHLARAEVDVYFDFAEWQSALTSVTTIPFTGFADGTLISTQYEAQGILFDSPHPFTLSGIDLFLNDGAGITTNTLIQDIEAQFSQPQYGIAAHFTGSIQLEIFSDGASTFLSDTYGGAPGVFVGFVLDQPFDSAILFDPNDPVVVIDDLHFGVPGPGALPLLALAGIVGRRRRSAA